jgi:superfamily II DNA or RNA helicase
MSATVDRGTVRVHGLSGRDEHLHRLTFKLKPTAHQESPQVVCAARVEGDTLVVPRAYGLAQFGLPEGWPPPVHPPPRTHHIRLRAQQQQPEASEAVLSTLRSKYGAVLVLPCGFGKTTVGLHVACSLGGRCIVLVHKSVLLTQWVERVQQFVPEARVGVLRGESTDVTGCDVVIAMMQSVYRRADVYDLTGFNLLIVDEAHRAPASTFCAAVQAVEARYTLGLTATPDRADGLTGLMYSLLGPVAFRVTRPPINEATARVSTLPCSPSVCEKRLWGKDVVNSSKLVTDLARDEQRTRCILYDVAELAEQTERHIIVLGDRIDMLKRLGDGLTAREIDVSLIVGATKQKDREAGLRARVVLSTFSLAAEGLDCAWLDTLVLATPKGDITQAVGRILREHPTKQTPLVLDYKESVDSGMLMGLARKRKSTLQAHGFNVTTPEETDTTENHTLLM